MKFGKYLKQVREAAGLSQRDVADKLGYSTPQFISNWERGVSHPPVSAVKKISILYKVPADSIFQAILSSVINEVTADLTKKFNSSRAA